MNEAQRVVDEIRIFLSSNDQTQNDTLTGLAAGYARFCKDANDRLRRCDEFLRRGLRSEAIHLAEAEPNLLNLVATLDFADREQWQTIALSYGLEKPPSLLLEAAGALNEAYAEEQPLQNLLRKHRRLALARAPLSERIAVMHRLLELDPGQTFWEDDTRQFEKVRIDQLGLFLKQARQADDLLTLKSIEHEIENAQWLEPVPKRLLKDANDAINRINQSLARARLEVLGPELNQACQELDTDRAREVRERWRETAAEAGLSQSDPLWILVNPSLEWLDHQDTCATAVASLESCLADPQRTRTELEQTLSYTRRLNCSIPAGLETRADMRLLSLKANEDRRKWSIIGASAAAVILLVTATALLIQSQIRAREIATASKKLDEFIADGRLKDGEEFLAGLTQQRRALKNDSRFTALGQRLAAEEEKEGDRKTRFNNSISAAENAQFSEEARRHLATADELARYPDEKQKIAELRREQSIGAEKAQVERDGAFSTGLDGLARLVKDLEPTIQAGPTEEVSKALSAIERQHDDLARTSLTVSDHLRDQSNTLSTHIAALRMAYTARLRQSELVSRLTQCIGDAAAYHELLEDHVKEFPESQRSRDMARVVAERPVWEAVVMMNQMFDTWRENLFDLESTKAADRLKQCREFLEEHAAGPHTEDIRAYVKILEAIARRETSPGEGARPNLQRLLSDVFVSNLWVVRTKAGEIYYLKKEPRPDEGIQTLITVKYISDNDGKEESKGLRRQDIASTASAPQSELAKGLKAILANVTPADWERVMLQIAGQIQNNKDVDPVLQVLLLDKTLQYAAEGSYPLELALKKDRDRLREAASELSSARWMDPLNQDAKRARVQAREVMVKVRDFNEIRASIKEPLDKLARELIQTREWIGWLTRDEQGKWTCRLKNPLVDPSTLWVAAPTASVAAWRQVGLFDGEKTDMSGVNALTGLDGRLIFAQKAANP